MGLFDPLRKTRDEASKQSFLREPPIPESEKKYYQPDKYYTDTVPVLAVGIGGDYATRKVITFDERCKISNPSKNGLYVAEILLLEYCSYGTYPHPKNGYPGFWWFEYGIRNIGAKLESLEKRGFIQFSSPKESVSRLTISRLKEILTDLNLSTTGKKSELIQRLVGGVDEEDLALYIPDAKYKLTELGKLELSENEYIPYMHKHPQKTIDVGLFGPVFNVWEVNRRLPKEKDWRKIVSDIELERYRFLNR